MKRKIISLTTAAVMILGGVQTANAGILRGLAKAFGVKDDSPIMELCQLGDKIGNAVVAKKTDDAINNYGTSTVQSYEKWAEEWNTSQNNKLADFVNEKEEYMKDYCIQHGFYKLWVEKHGNNWFENEGREWFERQNELRIRRGEDELLPYHLRGSASEEVRHSPVESTLSHAILNDLGLSLHDVETANQWIESDKYGKQDMIIDAAFDFAGKFANNTEMLNGFRQLAKANNKFLKNKKNRNPHAVTERNIDFANIIYDAAQVSKEKKERLLQEKHQIYKELIDSGVYSDDPLALEVAGQILAIQKDKSLTEIEKKEWLCQLGYYDNVDEILQAAEYINNHEINVEPVIPKGPSPEEIEEQRRKEQEERERIEKENAIATIHNTRIERYTFDSCDLTEEQKRSLNEIAEIMNKYNDLSLTITGHTCSKGYKSVNRRIGLRRAETAKKFIVEKGVDANRIITDSMGEENPAVDNSPIENRQFNRRLEFIVK